MWVIGDIHGCLDELEELLDLIPRKDRLIFIGDYIDRGPASAGVVDRVLEEEHRSVFLKGNHEDMMMAYYRDPESREGLAWTFVGNGGPATLRSYGLTDSDSYDRYPKRHREFYENLQLYYETDDYIAVHAGVRIAPGKKNDSVPIEKQDPEDLIWIRDEWIRNEHRWNGKRVFYGHTPSHYVLGSAGEHDPIVGEKSVGLDTGCVFGGSLTAMNTQDDELIQVKARRNYYIS
ncbi:MAG: metallophosphoesterase [bacterium]|nr:metallophosphoesterase [bacterium]